jgi:hypothetical protein
MKITQIIKEGTSQQLKGLLEQSRNQFLHSGVESVRVIDIIHAIDLCFHADREDCLEYIFNDLQERIREGRGSLTKQGVDLLFQTYSEILTTKNLAMVSKLLCFEALFIDEMRGKIDDITQKIYSDLQNRMNLVIINPADQSPIYIRIRDELIKMKDIDDMAFSIAQDTVSSIDELIGEKNISRIAAEYLPEIDYIHQASDKFLSPSPSPAPQEYSKLQQDRCCVIT